MTPTGLSNTVMPPEVNSTVIALDLSAMSQ